MAVADKAVRGGGQPTADLVVAGAGVAGLWLALKAARAGLSVHIVDRAYPGAGASGGFLGALMPHSPERWNGKKEFQFRALVDLEDEIVRLQSETGLDCSYARVGRLIPLTTQGARAAAIDRIDEARTNWGGRFRFDVANTPDCSGWPDILRAPNGLVHETLSARLSPPALLAALSARLKAFPNVMQRGGVALTRVDPGQGMAHFSDGGRLGFGHLALANGVEAFAMIAAIAGCPAAPLGGPVKGQAALLDASVPAGLPLVYDDGIYVIAHGDGQVAVGSTSETQFANASAVDERLEQVLARARKLCPLIKHAPVISRWAGLRPRAAGRDPMLGPVPGAPNVLAMAGGFKITFGIAHRMAECLVAGMTGGEMPQLPESFSVESHIGKASSSVAND